jgi:hypothetical protein
MESPPVHYVGRGGIEAAMRAAADEAAAKYKKPAQLLLVIFPTKASSRALGPGCWWAGYSEATNNSRPARVLWPYSWWTSTRRPSACPTSSWASLRKW